MRTAVARFWSKVRRGDVDDCWVWTAGRSTEGYGMFWFAGQNRLTHRISYRMLRGTLDPALTIDHLCRNRACVNPSHLDPVDIKVNQLRGVSPWAQNARKTHCHHGHLLDDKNTYRPPGRAERHCRTCKRETMRQVRARRRGGLVG